jgi:hypothetical protein
MNVQVPDASDPHWQVVDPEGNTYLLQRLGVKNLGSLAKDFWRLEASVPRCSSGPCCASSGYRACRACFQFQRSRAHSLTMVRQLTRRLNPGSRFCDGTRVVRRGAVRAPPAGRSLLNKPEKMRRA